MVGDSGALGQVAVDVYADLTKLADDFKKGEVMAARFDSKVNSKFKQSAIKNEAALKDLERANDRLASSYSPLHAASTRYVRDLGDIDRLLKANMISSKEAAMYNQRAGAAFKAASGDMEKGASLAAKAGAYVGVAIAALAVAGVAGFVSAANNAINAGKAIDDMSKKLGIGVEELQRWTYAGKEFGLSAQEIESTFVNLDKSLSKAATGAEKEAGLFDALGVSLRNANGEAKSSAEIMPELIDALRQVGDENERAAAEMLLFGEAGAGIDKMVMAGSAAINELGDAAERLGIVLSADEIKSLAETNKAFEDMKNILSADISRFVANNASEIRGLSQDLLSFADACMKAISGFSSFLNTLDQNATRLEQGIARTLAAMATASGNMAGGAQLNQYAASFNGKLANGQPGDQGFGSKRRGRLDFSQAKPTKGGISLAGLNAPKGRSGGGGRGRKGPDPERERIKQMRDDKAFADQIAGFRIALLQAVSSQSTDAVLRADIERQILEIEKTKFDEMLKLEGPGGTKKYDAAQIEKLRLAYKEVDIQKRANIDAQAAEDARKESAALAESRMDNERDILEYAADSAKTMKARRKAEMDLLELQHRMEQAQLDGVIASEESSETEKQIARERKAHLEKLKKLQISSIERQTQGPLADFMSSIPQTADEITEAMERIDVSKLEDARNRSVQFADDISEAFANTARSIIALDKPSDILKNLLNDLASTFTEEVLIRPLKEFALKSIGRPLAEQATGAPAGPEGLWSKTLEKSSLSASVQIDAMARAAARFSQLSPSTGQPSLSSALFSTAGHDGAVPTGDAAQGLNQAADENLLPLADASKSLTSELLAQKPVIADFGVQLAGVLAGLAVGGGGGGGFLSSIIGIAGMVAGSMSFGGGKAIDGGKLGKSLPGVESFIKTLPGKAKGGATPRRMPFMVGENGIEALWDDANHFISTNRQTTELQKRMDSLSRGIPANTQPGLRMGQMGGGRSKVSNFRFGDIVLPGITDERAGRRVGKQVSAAIRGDMARSASQGYGNKT